MMRCEDLSERMPALAAGAEWTAPESSHLGTCPACTSEWLVVVAVGRLGGQAPRLDPKVVASRVLERLRAEGTPVSGSVTERRQPRSRSVRWLAAGLAAAAALALAIGVGRDDGAPNRGLSLPQAEMLLTELEGLTGAELEEIMVQLEVDDIGSGGDPGLADLTNEELDRLLRSWEG
ncbi:MAG: hypothetical protein KF785_02590 [Gemmatimonadales bacterium]|nr:hypothetical protein [Gemmatimonadales bacterium]